MYNRGPHTVHADRGKGADGHRGPIRFQPSLGDTVMKPVTGKARLDEQGDRNMRPMEYSIHRSDDYASN